MTVSSRAGEMCIWEAGIDGMVRKILSIHRDNSIDVELDQISIAE